MKMQTMRRSVALVFIVAMSACETVRTVPPSPGEVRAEHGLWALLVRPTADAAEPPERPPLTGQGRSRRS